MTVKPSVISYHTLIFPFLFDTNGKVNRSRFLKYVPALHSALRQDTVDWDAVPCKQLFDQYRYFNQAARNAIYSRHFDASDIVWNYRYDLEYMATGKTGGQWLSGKKDHTNPAVLTVRHGAFQAKLAINGVRLKLFNTGIGMLVFELENYELTGEDDIIAINEYCRRVFMPYIGSDDARTCDLCADDISLLYDGKVIEGASGTVGAADSRRLDKITLAPFVKYFLSNSKRSVTASPRPGKQELFIEPIIDDRMFVACLCGIDGFSADMAQWDEETQTYGFLAQAEERRPLDTQSLANRLYRMMFIDGDEITCHSRSMLKSLLQEHTYTRWLEQYHTITGITEYSMITVATRQGVGFLATPFLAEYVEMIYLVLAQRATFLSFERIISDIACANEKFRIEAVQKRYILFQSQLLLQEVTAQQQGIELYNMLTRSLFIQPQEAGIEGQIKSLSEWNTSASEKTENAILFFLTTLGIVECADVLLGTWFQLQVGIVRHSAIAVILFLAFTNFFGRKILNTVRTWFKHR